MKHELHLDCYVPYIDSDIIMIKRFLKLSAIHAYAPILLDNGWTKYLSKFSGLHWLKFIYFIIDPNTWMKLCFFHKISREKKRECFALVKNSKVPRSNAMVTKLRKCSRVFLFICTWMNILHLRGLGSIRIVGKYNNLSDYL